MDMDTQNYTFSPIQQKAIGLLSAGLLSIVDVAEQCEIERKTIYNWYENVPGFKEAIQRQSATTVKTVRDKLNKLLDDSVNTIEDIIISQEHRNNKNLGRLIEVLFKSTGVLEQKTNQVFIILQRDDVEGQIDELFDKIIERLPLASEEYKQKMIEKYSTVNVVEGEIIQENQQLTSQETKKLT